jgi:hypothetical protein
VNRSLVTIINPVGTSGCLLAPGHGIEQTGVYQPVGKKETKEQRVKQKTKTTGLKRVIAVLFSFFLFYFPFGYVPP